MDIETSPAFRCEVGEGLMLHWSTADNTDGYALALEDNRVVSLALLPAAYLQGAETPVPSFPGCSHRGLSLSPPFAGDFCQANVS